MQHHTHTPRPIRLLLTTLTTTLILATAVNTATAGRFSVSNNRIRAVWANLELTNTITSDTIRCPITLEGSFHSSTFIKRLELLVGYVTRATVVGGACTGGRTTVNEASLPWHVTYQGFTGTLPNITGLIANLIRASYRIENPSATCEATSTIARPMKGITNLTSGTVTSMRSDETASIPLTGGLCIFGSGRFSGTASVTLLGTNNAISIRLI